jgi:hypothetical protein
VGLVSYACPQSLIRRFVARKRVARLAEEKRRLSLENRAATGITRALRRALGAKKRRIKKAPPPAKASTTTARLEASLRYDRKRDASVQTDPVVVLAPGEESKAASRPSSSGTQTLTRAQQVLALTKSRRESDALEMALTAEFGGSVPRPPASVAPAVEPSPLADTIQSLGMTATRRSSSGKPAKSAEELLEEMLMRNTGEILMSPTSPPDLSSPTVAPPEPVAAARVADSAKEDPPAPVMISPGDSSSLPLTSGPDTVALSQDFDQPEASPVEATTVPLSALAPETSVSEPSPPADGTPVSAPGETASEMVGAVLDVDRVPTTVPEAAIAELEDSSQLPAVGGLPEGVLEFDPAVVPTAESSDVPEVGDSAWV